MPFTELILLLAHRFQAALTILPTGSAWGVTAALLGLYTLIALPLGLRFGFIQREMQTSPRVVREIMIVALLSPALSEELIFRVLLLPHASEHLSGLALLFWGVGGLIVFILYHPLNGISFFPAGRQTFFNPVFLGLAALLGVICTLAYWQSGSIWPPVALHWIVVVVWLLTLGGYRQLNREYCDG